MFSHVTRIRVCTSAAWQLLEYGVMPHPIMRRDEAAWQSMSLCRETLDGISRQSSDARDVGGSNIQSSDFIFRQDRALHRMCYVFILLV